MRNTFPISIIALITALLLSGCLEPEKKPIATVGEAILAAEANGTIPKLNHDDTIAGPDTDANGIRDDIDAYIATLPYTDVQKKAVQQNALALSSALTVDTTDKVALQIVADKMSRAPSCLYSKLTDGTAGNIALALEKMTVNTKNRFLQYEKYNLARSGSVSKSPEGDACE